MVRQCYGGLYAFGGANVAVEAWHPLVVIKVSYFFNHTLSISLVYPHRDPYPPPGYAQGYSVGRNDDAVLRGAVGAEDDGARVVHNSTAT